MNLDQFHRVEQQLADLRIQQHDLEEEQAQMTLRHEAETDELNSRIYATSTAAQALDRLVQLTSKGTIDAH